MAGNEGGAHRHIIRALEISVDPLQLTATPTVSSKSPSLLQFSGDLILDANKVTVKASQLVVSNELQLRERLALILITIPSCTNLLFANKVKGYLLDKITLTDFPASAGRNPTLNSVVTGFTRFMNEQVFETIRNFEHISASGIDKAIQGLGETVKKSLGQGLSKVCLETFTRPDGTQGAALCVKKVERVGRHRMIGGISSSLGPRASAAGSKGGAALRDGYSIVPRSQPALGN
jgi:hypothetical protein